MTDEQRDAVLFLTDEAGNQFAIPAGQLDQYRFPGAADDADEVVGFNLDTANSLRNAQGTGARYPTPVRWGTVPIAGPLWKPVVGWHR